MTTDPKALADKIEAFAHGLFSAAEAGLLLEAVKILRSLPAREEGRKPSAEAEACGLSQEEYERAEANRTIWWRGYNARVKEESALSPTTPAPAGPDHTRHMTDAEINAAPGLIRDAPVPAGGVREVVCLSSEAYEHFMNVLDNPPAPTQALIDLMRSRR